MAVSEVEVLRLSGSPTPGTLTFDLSANAPGVGYQDVMEFSMPLSDLSNDIQQEPYFSPLVSTNTQRTSFVVTLNTQTASGSLQDSIPADQYLRCDNAQEVNGGTGCVNPEYTPLAIYLNTDFPNIAPNIAADQSATGRGNLSNPLHRDSTMTTTNRNAACSPARIAELLGSAPPNMVNPSCDEYPFAGTSEGGATARIAWVPRAENDSQGTFMASFFRLNRVMNGDAFSVATQ